MRKQILLKAMTFFWGVGLAAQALERETTIEGAVSFEEAQTDSGRCILARFRAAANAQAFCNHHGKIVHTFNGGSCVHELPFPWVKWQVTARYTMTCRSY